DRLSIIQNKGLLDILDDSEHHEHRDDCPFVPMAINYKNTEFDTITKLEDEIDSLTNLKKQLENDIDSRGNDYRFMNYYNKIKEANKELGEIKYSDEYLEDVIIKQGSDHILENELNEVPRLRTTYKYSYNETKEMERI